MARRFDITAKGRATPLLALALSLAVCGCDVSAPAPSTPVRIEVQGVGLDGLGAPIFATVERTTTPFTSGSSAIDLYVPIDSDGPTPLVILLQGARVHKSYYSGFCARIAAHGFIVAAANHDSTLGYFTSTSSVRDVLTHLADRANDLSDPLMGLLDLERVGIVGHSFGGATALTLVQGDCNFPFCAMPFERPSSIRAVAAYAAHLVEWTGDVVSVDARGLPIQMMFGDRDTVAHPSDVERTFDALRNNAKQLIRLKGANHFAINDLNNPPGTITDSNIVLVEQDASIAIAADWVGLFMRAQVSEDADAIEYLLASGTQENERFDATFEPFQLPPIAQAHRTAGAD